VPNNNTNAGSPIELFIAYTFLPVSQYSRILSSIAEVHEILRAEQLTRGTGAWLSLPAVPIPFDILIPPPLCIAAVHTGDSITVRFAAPGEWLPKMAIRRGELEVVLPRWTALMVLTGAAFTWGLDQYQDFLNVAKTKQEIVKGELEIEKLKAELQTAPRPSADSVARIELHVQELRYHIQQPNIQAATLNGVSLKEFGADVSRTRSQGH
jgi:hypothetical protein